MSGRGQMYQFSGRSIIKVNEIINRTFFIGEVI